MIENSSPETFEAVAEGPARTETGGAQTSPTETVEQPAKVVRLAAMLKQLLEEVRLDDLGPGARSRLRNIYEISVQELTEAVSPDLRTELVRLAMPFEEPAPSEGELRVAQAQLVGWLEGLIHGVQAALRAQHVAAASGDQLRQRVPGGGPEMAPPSGTYL